MKATGIVRRVDELGRIVLPIELRRTLDIAEKDTLEIYVEGSSIILKCLREVFEGASRGQLTAEKRRRPYRRFSTAGINEMTQKHIKIPAKP